MDFITFLEGPKLKLYMEEEIGVLFDSKIVEKSSRKGCIEGGGC